MHTTVPTLYTINSVSIVRRAIRVVHGHQCYDLLFHEHNSVFFLLMVCFLCALNGQYYFNIFTYTQETTQQTMSSWPN